MKETETRAWKWPRWGSWSSSPTSIKIAGSHVCVTGGSEGIGKAIAEVCVQKGAASVTLIARNYDKLQSAASQLSLLAEKLFDRSKSSLPWDSCCPTRTNAWQAFKGLFSSISRSPNNSLAGRAVASAPCAIHIVSCDVSEPDQVKAAFARIWADLNIPTCDVLFCCAGLAILDVVEDLTVEDYQRVLNTGLLGAILCVKEAVEGMMSRRRGAVCLMLSQAAQVSIYGFTAYSAAKYGLKGFGEALTMELAPFDVSVHLAFPADVDTPGFAVENKRKPRITDEISGTSGLWQAIEVAKITVDAVERGTARIHYGWTGWALDVLTSAASPVVGFWRSLVEILLVGTFRFIFVLVLRSWNRFVRYHPELCSRASRINKVGKRTRKVAASSPNVRKRPSTRIH